jgi:hypothetical protein
MNTKVLLGLAVAFTVVVLCVGPAVADTIVYPVREFETPVRADGLTSTSHTSWVDLAGGVSSQTVTKNPTSDEFIGADGDGTLPSPAGGSQCLANSGTGLNPMNGAQAVREDGYKWTYLGETHSKYTFSAAIGIPLSGLTNQKCYMGIYATNFPAGSAGYAQQVYVEVDLSSITPGTFKEFSVDYYTDNYPLPEGLGGSNMRMVLAMQGAVYADNCQIVEETDTSPVPEPSTVVLLASGLIGLAVYAWRKRK